MAKTMTTTSAAPSARATELVEDLAVTNKRRKTIREGEAAVQAALDALHAAEATLAAAEQAEAEWRRPERDVRLAREKLSQAREALDRASQRAPDQLMNSLSPRIRTFADEIRRELLQRSDRIGAMDNPSVGYFGGDAALRAKDADRRHAEFEKRATQRRELNSAAGSIHDILLTADPVPALEAIVTKFNLLSDLSNIPE